MLPSRGVVYFADDDNTYDLRLFGEMRSITSVGVWPVALVGGLMLEQPLVDEHTGRVVEFAVGWKPQRPFPIDMAAFAVHTSLLQQHTGAEFHNDVPRGYVESSLLQALNVSRGDLQLRGGIEALVWHTRTEAPKLDMEHAWRDTHGRPSHDGVEI